MPKLRLCCGHEMGHFRVYFGVAEHGGKPTGFRGHGTSLRMWHSCHQVSTSIN